MLNRRLGAFAITLGLIGPAMAQERILISSRFVTDPIVAMRLVLSCVPAEAYSPAGVRGIAAGGD
jgi:hypothetical protein